MNNAVDGVDSANVKIDKNASLIALLPPSYKKYRHIPHKCSTCCNIKCLFKWMIVCWKHCPEWIGENI